MNLKENRWVSPATPCGRVIVVVAACDRRTIVDVDGRLRVVVDPVRLPDEEPSFGGGRRMVFILVILVVVLVLGIRCEPKSASPVTAPAGFRAPAPLSPRWEILPLPPREGAEGSVLPEQMVPGDEVIVTIRGGNLP